MHTAKPMHTADRHTAGPTHSGRTIGAGKHGSSYSISFGPRAHSRALHFDCPVEMGKDDVRPCSTDCVVGRAHLGGFSNGIPILRDVEIDCPQGLLSGNARLFSVCQPSRAAVDPSGDRTGTIRSCARSVTTHELVLIACNTRCPILARVQPRPGDVLDVEGISRSARRYRLLRRGPLCYKLFITHRESQSGSTNAGPCFHSQYPRIRRSRRQSCDAAGPNSN
jgi:hypothetical protein